MLITLVTFSSSASVVSSFGAPLAPVDLSALCSI